MSTVILPRGCFTGNIFLVRLYKVSAGCMLCQSDGSQRRAEG